MWFINLYIIIFIMNSDERISGEVTNNEESPNLIKNLNNI